MNLESWKSRFAEWQNFMSHRVSQRVKRNVFRRQFASATKMRILLGAWLTFTSWDLEERRRAETAKCPLRCSLAMCYHHRYLFPVLSRTSRCQNAQKAQGRLLLSSRQEVYIRRSPHVHVRTHVRVNVGHFTFNNSSLCYIE